MTLAQAALDVARRQQPEWPRKGRAPEVRLGAAPVPGAGGLSITRGGPASESRPRTNAKRLLARAQSGERLREREKRGLTLGERIAVQRAEREVLRAMSARERLLAYRRGHLSAYQLGAWWSEYPCEIPRIDGHPEWIAVSLVDVCERRQPAPSGFALGWR